MNRCRRSSFVVIGGALLTALALTLTGCGSSAQSSKQSSSGSSNSGGAAAKSSSSAGHATTTLPPAPTTSTPASITADAVDFCFSNSSSKTWGYSVTFSNGVTSHRTIDVGSSSGSTLYSDPETGLVLPTPLSAKKALGGQPATCGPLGASD